MNSTIGDRSLVAVPTSFGRRNFEELCPPKMCRVLRSVAHCDAELPQVAMPCVVYGAVEQPLHVDAHFGVCGETEKALAATPPPLSHIGLTPTPDQTHVGGPIGQGVFS